MTQTTPGQPETILLDRFQFAHVKDCNTAQVRLVEGPTRLQLQSNEELVKIFDKIKVSSNQFACVWHPFNKDTGDLVQGEHEFRVGPTIFSLHPGEQLGFGGKVQDAYILTDDDALLLRADKEVPHPLKDGESIQAGTEILLRGPRKFIPHKDILVKERRRAIALTDTQGVFIQNDDTGVVRLERGPKSIFLEQNESLWDKILTEEELQALGFKEQTIDKDSRVLSATPRARAKNSDAVVIDLEDNEAICIFDGNKSRVEFGPKILFLGQHERPKVLFISGGVPIRPSVLRLSKLKLGPDFIRDRLSVRTRDNATLTLDVNFRWRFQVDREHPEKIFATKDFIGFAAQSLSSEIRETAAAHTFEDFHAKAAELIKKAVFQGKEGRVFPENGLEIFGVDVESITPTDKEIASKLADAIKSNVDIVTHRIKEEAQLESQLRLIEGRARNAKAEKQLIELQVENDRTSQIEKARIAADAAKATAEIAAESTKVTAQGEAEAHQTKEGALIELERKRLEIQIDADRRRKEIELNHVRELAKVEIEKHREITEHLNSEGGKTLVALEHAKLGATAQKILVLPTDSRLHLGLPPSLLRNVFETSGVSPPKND
ncbi:hypothetical protein HYV73_02990 [Candidatus Uhrbacteria bacterium]|nr:hypothetical protein [Candidatus Uhrbacteria bacterium]